MLNIESKGSERSYRLTQPFGVLLGNNERHFQYLHTFDKGDELRFEARVAFYVHNEPFLNVNKKGGSFFKKYSHSVSLLKKLYFCVVVLRCCIYDIRANSYNIAM